MRKRESRSEKNGTCDASQRFRDDNSNVRRTDALLYV
jgi:hypothetical protein